MQGPASTRNTAVVANVGVGRRNHAQRRTYNTMEHGIAGNRRRFVLADEVASTPRGKSVRIKHPHPLGNEDDWEGWMRRPNK